MAPKSTKRNPTTYRPTDDDLRMLNALADLNGRSAHSMLLTLIREAYEANRELIKVHERDLARNAKRRKTQQEPSS